MIVQTFFVKLAECCCKDGIVLIIRFCDSGFDSDFCVCLLGGGSGSESAHVCMEAKVGNEFWECCVGEDGDLPTGNVALGL